MFVLNPNIEFMYSDQIYETKIYLGIGLKSELIFTLATKQSKLRVLGTDSP